MQKMHSKNIGHVLLGNAPVVVNGTWSVNVYRYVPAAASVLLLALPSDPDCTNGLREDDYQTAYGK